MSKTLSLVVSAPSGAGKSTLIQELMKRDARFTFSVSTTTRAPRQGEIEGVNYYYVSDGEFDAMVACGDFIEWAHVHTHRYGTSKKEIDRIRAAGRIPVFDVDVQGAKNLTSQLDDSVLVFILPPDIDALKSRLMKRNTESSDELSVRLRNAVKEIEEFVAYNYLIVNDRVEQAVDDLQSVVRAEFLRNERMKDIALKILEEAK